MIWYSMKILVANSLDNLIKSILTKGDSNDKKNNL